MRNQIMCRERLKAEIVRFLPDEETLRPPLNFLSRPLPSVVPFFDCRRTPFRQSRAKDIFFHTFCKHLPRRVG